MPGSADKFTPSAQCRLLWPGMTAEYASSLSLLAMTTRRQNLFGPTPLAKVAAYKTSLINPQQRP